MLKAEIYESNISLWEQGNQRPTQDRLNWLGSTYA
jgi:hypothetical protein